jgi:alpha-N-acetylglucosaminidase
LNDPHFTWQYAQFGYGSENRDPRFVRGVQAFLSCADSLKQSPLYRADAIEQAAMVLGMKADEWFVLARQAHEAGDAATRDKALARALELLGQCDRILESHPLHRLQRWLDFACAHGPQYESNARRIITVWGPPVNDYSCRLWSGLIRDYYRPRMRLAFQSLTSGKGADMAKWEENWVRATGVSKIEPYPDPLAAARQLVERACSEKLPPSPSPSGRG